MPFIIDLKETVYDEAQIGLSLNYYDTRKSLSHSLTKMFLFFQKCGTFACNPIKEHRYASLHKLFQLYKLNNLWQLFHLWQLLQHDS